jgi:uncharacterized membrane protein
MKTRLVKLNEQLRTSLWAIPALSTFVAGVLAFVLIEFDRRVEESEFALTWIFRGGADSARAVLSTIAGSVITVAGTIYSITIVVLTLASVQFAPRVLRHFLRDRSNQVVLGFFVATFAYCLIVLRAIGATESFDFVPGTAVAGGVMLGLVSLGMLIYFIDHIAHSIQASSLIATVAKETLKQIDALYPENWRETEAVHDHLHPDLLPPGEWKPVSASGSGYLQYIDYERLLALATRHDVVVREDRAVGAFIIAGTPVALVMPPERLSDELCAQINKAFVLGSQPTLQQDVAYGIRQIVDIGIKAISPAVNDPTTSLNCIDHIGVILGTLVTRRLPDLDRMDAEGKLRIIMHERTFNDLARLAFDQLRHFGAKDPVIVIRLLDTIAHVATVAKCVEYREVLGRHVERIAAAAEREIADPYEIEAVRGHAERARQATPATQMYTRT